jgi:hypothetical protein
MTGLNVLDRDCLAKLRHLNAPRSPGELARSLAETVPGYEDFLGAGSFTRRVHTSLKTLAEKGAVRKLEGGYEYEACDESTKQTKKVDTMKNPVLGNGDFYDCDTIADGADPTMDFTLWDLYAGFALQGLLSSRGVDGTAEEVAAECLALADAMMAARAGRAP